jgi:transposase
VLDRLNRHDLSEEEWEHLRVFLPADPPRGGRWADHRMVVNGIFFRTRAGCPWRDLPEGACTSMRPGVRRVPAADDRTGASANDKKTGREAIGVPGPG